MALKERVSARSVGSGTTWSRRGQGSVNTGETNAPALHFIYGVLAQLEHGSRGLQHAKRLTPVRIQPVASGTSGHSRLTLARQFRALVGNRLKLRDFGFRIVTSTAFRAASMM
jgi:hypothetical protein